MFLESIDSNYQRKLNYHKEPNIKIIISFFLLNLLIVLFSEWCT